MATYPSYWQLWCSAAPDQGLCTWNLSGKKKDKFHITLGVACNADRSKKLPLWKSKNPHCFKKVSPEKWGFYYQNNKKAWITAEFFEEFVESTFFSNWNLSKDSFAGGSKYSTYACEMLVAISLCSLTTSLVILSNTNPKISTLNISSQISHPLFNPVMLESFIVSRLTTAMLIAFEPLSLTRLMNLIYIYKIDLLKAMLMVRDAWDKVTAKTIKHC